MSFDHPRDLVGYGGRPPFADWPGGARIALSFVLNYEEGGENCVLYGDAASETRNAELEYPAPTPGERMLSIESMYEYGSRVGFWRIHKVFERLGIPLTIYAIGLALEQNPDAAAAMVEANYEIASHGWRWIDYKRIPEAEERAHLDRSIALIKRMTGRRPVGFYMGRPSFNTRRIVVEEGGFLYDSDSYNDDLPFWVDVGGKQHLVLPYAQDTNDNRFSRGQGIETVDQYVTFLKDTFDWLYAEGAETPRMMSVGMHCRLIGKPGRTVAIQRFLDHVAKHDHVWICRREDIARHWHARHPAHAAP
jgi:putative urate catabolism protein